MIKAKLGNETALKIPISVQCTWEDLIEYVKKQDIPAAEKEEIVSAYQKLNIILGNRFLTHRFKNRLPLGQNFHNRAPWVFKWCIWLSEALEIMESHGYSRFILNKLISKNYYHEGISLLELAYFFHKAGFKLEFDNVVVVNGQQKHPDIKISNPKLSEDIYIELSELSTADHMKIGNRSFDLATNLLFKVMWRTGKISEFDKTDAKKYLDKLNTAIEKANKEGKLVIVDEWPFHLALSSKKTEKFCQWAEENGYSPNALVGDKIEFNNEIDRVKGKIHIKAKQLGDDNINVVVLHAHSLFFIGVNLLDAITEITKELEKYPKLLGVLIYGDFSFAPTERHGIVGNCLFSIRVIGNVNKRTFLFIRNIYHQSKISEESLGMFVNAFVFGENVGAS